MDITLGGRGQRIAAPVVRYDRLAGVAAAIVLAVAYLLLPRMGTDLSAQVARADFFAAHGTALVDLRWYGGVHQFGYSLLSPAVMALLGVRVTGAVALVTAAAAFTALLYRTGAPRPLVGSLVGAACLAGNLVSGRVTYGLGVAFALLGLLALTVRQPATRYATTALAGLLAAATSPVVALFLGLVGVALVLARRTTPGLLLSVVAAAPLAVTAGLFGDGGWMNISRSQAAVAVVAGLAVAALVNVPVVRYGSLLSSAGVLAAAVVHTPVGLNATRLAVMFTVPVLAAWARLPRARPGLWLAALLVAACGWQPPVVISDLRLTADPTAREAYFAPLLARIRSAPVTGRVEIPPTTGYWEAASMGDVPLARGWLRQADIDRNPLFFTTVPGAPGTGVALTADSYRAWLAEQAVQYVAVPAAPLSWVGRAEAALIAGGLPYLLPVWSTSTWQLYAVRDATALVTAPAVLTAHTAATLTFTTPVAGTVQVRVWFSRWLTVGGGATVAADGHWTRVTVPAPGTYTLTS